MSRHGQSCVNCCYWQRYKETVDGYCQRHAPTLSGEERDYTAWPVTHTHKWCGDWEENRDFVATVKEV